MFLLALLPLLAAAQPATTPTPTPAPAPPAAPTAPAPASATLTQLHAWAALPAASRPQLATQDFAKAPLTKADAAAATELLWSVKAADLAAARKKEWDAKSITLADKTMKFEFKVFGDKPKNGRSLWISMHGGGGAPPEVNEQQWRNQIGLYTPPEGVYLAPRAPTDTWNLWHESHIDDFFDRIIEDAITFEGVDPDKVYLMGYSAGGDGVYQLAPRMADRFAAVSMMAGHPNDAAPDNLRNLPFAIHMGANDSAYKRNEVAKAWGEKLDALQKADPYPKLIAKGQKPYTHVCELHAGKGHWMDRQDAKAIDWMRPFTRSAFPKYIVWQQTSRPHTRFYWLGLSEKDAAKPVRLVARVEGQAILLTTTGEPQRIDLWLADGLVDLDKPVRVVIDGKKAADAIVPRTAESIWASWARADRAATAPARLQVDVR